MARSFRSNLPQSKPHRRMPLMRSTRSRRSFAPGKRARASERSHHPFLPPEDWHEPEDDNASRAYKIIVQEPGPGYRHVVTADEVRQRLLAFPARLVESLGVVQLSRMTRKKETLPCYGMQWGTSVYLYPIEASLIERFARAPLAAERREAEMYGGRWEESSVDGWRLVWTADTIRDFYLNNILIHELGHLIDDRNRSYTDRERFADWFAIQYGYKSSFRLASLAGRRPAPATG
ncbi:MAG: hypothetical protein ACYC6N_00595 [Pirellulaceae bacterium]